MVKARKEIAIGMKTAAVPVSEIVKYIGLTKVEIISLDPPDTRHAFVKDDWYKESLEEGEKTKLS
jgi:hypothetical protein